MHVPTSVLAVALAVAAVLGQQLDDCIATCMIQGSMAANCDTSDTKCVCASATYLHDTASCLVSTCPASDWQTTQQFLQSTCGSVGINISLSPSPQPAASSTAKPPPATPSPTANPGTSSVSGNAQTAVTAGSTDSVLSGSVLAPSVPGIVSPSGSNTSPGLPSSASGAASLRTPGPGASSSPSGGGAANTGGSSPDQGQSSGHHSTNIGAIVGGVIGGLAVVLAVLAWIFRARWARLRANRPAGDLPRVDILDDPGLRNDDLVEKRPLSTPGMPADLPSAPMQQSTTQRGVLTVHPALPSGTHVHADVPSPAAHGTSTGSDAALLGSIAALREQLDAMRAQLPGASAPSQTPNPTISSTLAPGASAFEPAYSPPPPPLSPAPSYPHTPPPPSPPPAAAVPLPAPADLEKEIARLRAQIEQLQVHQLRHDVQAAPAPDGLGPGPGLGAGALQSVLASIAMLQQDVGELRMQHAQAHAAAAAELERLPSYSPPGARGYGV